MKWMYSSALLAVARIEGAVDDEAVRIVLRHRRIALDGVEAVLVEVLEIGRLDDRDVVGPSMNRSSIEIVGAVLLELALLPAAAPAGSDGSDSRRSTR